MSDNTIYDSGLDYDNEYADYDRDLGFLIRLATKYAQNYPPIAEFACGTGRVTSALAKAGFDIFGIDITPAMLDRAREKFSGQVKGVTKGYVELMRGDMRDSSTLYYRNHHLVLVPFTAFLHLTSQADQIMALKNFWGHLAYGGRLLVDIFNPKINRLTGKIGAPQEKIVEKKILIADGTQELVRSVITDYASDTQIAHWNFFVDIYDVETGGKIREYTRKATIQVIFPNEWRLLLHVSGFTIVEEWGDYEEHPFVDNSPRMLFLAKKTHDPLV